MTEKVTQLVLELRSLVVLYIGLGMSTTVHLVRTEGWAAPFSVACVVCAHTHGHKQRPP